MAGGSWRGGCPGLHQNLRTGRAVCRWIQQAGASSAGKRQTQGQNACSFSRPIGGGDAGALLPDKSFEKAYGLWLRPAPSPPGGRALAGALAAVSELGRRSDEAGNAQPLRAEFVAHRGELPAPPPILAFPNQHYNSITSWAIAANGEVKHVYA